MSTSSASAPNKNPWISLEIVLVDKMHANGNLSRKVGRLRGESLLAGSCGQSFESIHFCLLFVWLPDDFMSSTRHATGLIYLWISEEETGARKLRLVSSKTRQQQVLSWLTNFSFLSASRVGVSSLWSIIWKLGQMPIVRLISPPSPLILRLGLLSWLSGPIMMKMTQVCSLFPRLVCLASQARRRHENSRYGSRVRSTIDCFGRQTVLLSNPFEGKDKVLLPRSGLMSAVGV